jgi:hypothetical protein
MLLSACMRRVRVALTSRVGFFAHGSEGPLPRIALCLVVPMLTPNQLPVKGCIECFKFPIKMDSSGLETVRAGALYSWRLFQSRAMDATFAGSV